MKKILFIFIIFMFVGCGFKVLVKDDPFKKSTVVSVDMWHEVIEGNLDNVAAKYYREIQGNRKTNAVVNFHFKLGAMMGMVANPYSNHKNVGLDKYAYILIDGESYKLGIRNLKTDRNLTIYGNNRSLYAGTYNDLYGTLQLNRKIEDKIINSKSVMYRFSAGGDATTLKATSGQLEALKNFLSANNKK